MSDERRSVLRALAERSSSDGVTTTVPVVAEALDLPASTVEGHVEGLVDCDLARRTADGVRVTLTGEELLALDLDGPVVVDPGD